MHAGMKAEEINIGKKKINWCNIGWNQSKILNKNAGIFQPLLKSEGLQHQIRWLQDSLQWEWEVGNVCLELFMCVLDIDFLVI